MVQEMLRKDLDLSNVIGTTRSKGNTSVAIFLIPYYVFLAFFVKKDWQCQVKIMHIDEL